MITILNKDKKIGKRRNGGDLICLRVSKGGEEQDERRKGGEVEEI